MPTGIGDALREAREEQGRTLEDASRTTRVRAEYLRALEEERFEQLGGDVYAKGFLSTYARFLGLDPAPLLDVYRREVQAAGYDPVALVEHPVARPPGRAFPTWLAWSVLGGFLLVAALSLANTLGPRTPPPALEPTAPVASPSPSPVGEPTPDPTPDPSPEPSPDPEPEGVNLVILVEEDCWMDVRADGMRPFSARTFRPGDAIEVTAQDVIDLRVGNAGGIRVVLNGRDLGTPGSRGQVLNGICTVDDCTWGR